MNLQNNSELFENSTKNQNASSSPSLLDILIKKEKPTDEADPLDHIGNISEDIIGQFSSGGNDLINALKMFDDAMSYMKPTGTPKRRYARRQTFKQEYKTAPLLSSLSIAAVEKGSSAKKFHQSDLRAGFSPRTKFDVDCSEFFQHGQKEDSQFTLLHQKLEKERTQTFNNQVSKDVDRLLHAANKLYGPKEWTSSEKEEFTSYCRHWKSGTLSDNDKIGLKNFYTKAYGKEFQELIGQSAEPNQTSSNELLPGPSDACLTWKNILTIESAIKQENEESNKNVNCDAIENLEAIPFAPFHPGMKYEKEKEFRMAANSIFMEVFNNPRRAVPSQVATLSDTAGQFLFEKEDLELLMQKFNKVMKEENKLWTSEDIQELSRFYEMFRLKMHLTIVQTKEFGNFLRKAFGKLEQYEIERENDTTLKEKRKYWQEYKRTHVPVKKERKKHAIRTTPVRPYIKTNIDHKSKTEEEKRQIRAAYLRQWRLARKEKHQS